MNVGSWTEDCRTVLKWVINVSVHQLCSTTEVIQFYMDVFFLPLKPTIPANDSQLSTQIIRALMGHIIISTMFFTLHSSLHALVAETIRVSWAHLEDPNTPMMHLGFSNLLKDTGMLQSSGITSAPPDQKKKNLHNITSSQISCHRLQSIIPLIISDDQTGCIKHTSLQIFEGYSTSFQLNLLTIRRKLHPLMLRRALI